MKSMYIGSGDVTALLSGKETETHRKLIRRFVSNEIPFYNAKSSPIDALRTGAILEEIFHVYLGDDYLSQYKVVSDYLDVCKATLDFAKLSKGKVIDFIELKSVFMTDYQIINLYKDKPKSEYIPFLKKLYKHNYEQVQYQLMCTGLKRANLSYLEVQTYNDFRNYARVITKDEEVRFLIDRDEEVISKIKERITPFQRLKDYYVSF